MTPPVALVALLAFGCAWGGTLITLSPLFAWLRVAAVRRTWHGWGDLAGCQFCCSSWLALVGVLVFRPDVTDLPLILDLPVAWGAVAGGAALIGLPMRRLLLGDKKPVTLTEGGKP